MSSRYFDFQEFENSCGVRENIYIGKDKYISDMEIDKRTYDTHRILLDSEAKNEVIYLLKKYKQSGKNEINILKIVSELNLPIEQIDKILDDLKKQDIIRDVE